MTTLTATEARKNLTRWLKAATGGQEIGIVYGADIFALRQVPVHAADYAQREYGVTTGQLEAFTKRTDAELAILHQRARDILRGRFEAYESSRTAAHPQWTALLDAVVAMRDEAWPRTAHALGLLAESLERAPGVERLPPHTWTVAQAALSTSDVEVRGVAARLVAAMMKTTAAAPPRGWLGLAHALAACGLDDLATTARRGAALAKETGAEEALALALTRKGWQLAQIGDSAQAIERLREARALSAPR